MKKKLKTVLFLFAALFIVVSSVNAQSFLKGKEKDAYKCGYVYKPSFLSKLKPMKIISKLAGGLMKGGAKSDLSEATLFLTYFSNLIPNHNLDFVTKTEGWETCGDGVSVVFFDYTGIGLTDTDGDVKVNGEKLEGAGMGTYFKGFSADKRGNKKIEITSSTGDKVEVNFEPVPSLEILSVNGKKKGEDIVIDGTQDVVIELKNGDIEKDSQLYVEIIISAMSIKAQSHLFISNPTNTLVIPKESFVNFDMSPLPLVGKNTLSVSRVREEIIHNTDAGPIQKLAMYTDFVPVLLEGDIVGGNIITNSLSSDKNTKLDDKFKVIEGEYNFQITKQNAYKSPPTSRMKKVGIGSFVIRGNLFQEKTTKTVSEKRDIYANTITTTTTTSNLKKWFPELSDDSWQKFANKMYEEFVNKVKTDLNVEVIKPSEMLNAKMYEKLNPIIDTVTKTFIQKGAYGTKALVTPGTINSLGDIRMTFVDDNPVEKLLQELDVDALIAVTIDLNFDLKTEGLNPVISIVAFAPNVSFRTPATYFGLSADTKSKPLIEVNTYNKITGGPEDIIYKLMKADDFFNAFTLAIRELKNGENKVPAYQKIWKDRKKRKTEYE
jgi:hypothetical protein